MGATEIEHITIVGSGTMGHGIGQVFAQGGYDVVMHDVSEERVARALVEIRSGLQQQVEWKLVSPDDAYAALQRISVALELKKAVANADLVIEAVPENLSLKLRVFRDLDAACAPHVILASNTSSLMPSTLAEATRRPERFVAMHFFYPPPLMPLVEIVGTCHVPEERLLELHSLLTRVGKSPIIVRKEAAGFIANRLQVALLREATSIIDKGIASAHDVDTAVTKSFGRRLATKGPIEMAEVQDGWDVICQIDDYMLRDLDPSIVPAAVLTKMVAQGSLGAKSGAGFYDWPQEKLQEWSRELETSLAEQMRADAEKREARVGAAVEHEPRF